MKVRKLAGLAGAAMLFLAALAPMGLAADNNVLYYLIEMQRQRGGQCNGATLPPAPSLVPSDKLSEIAWRHGANQTPVPELLAANNISYSSLLVLHTPDAPPADAVNALKSMACEELLGGPYTQIGAEKANGYWWLVMLAPAQKGQVVLGGGSAQYTEPGAQNPAQPGQAGQVGQAGQPGQPGQAGQPGQPGQPGQSNSMSYGGLGGQPQIPQAQTSQPLPGVVPIQPGQVISRVEDKGQAGAQLSGSNYNNPQNYDPNFTPLPAQNIQVEAERYEAPGLSAGAATSGVDSGQPGQSGGQPGQPGQPGGQTGGQALPYGPSTQSGQPGQPGQSGQPMQPGQPSPAAPGGNVPRYEIAPGGRQVPLAYNIGNAAGGAQPALQPGMQPGSAPANPVPPNAAQGQRPTSGNAVFLNSPGASSGTFPGASPSGAVAPQAITLQGEPQKMLGAINKIRGQGRICDGLQLPPASALQAEQTLTRTATAHSVDMQANRYLSATGQDGRNMGQKLRDSGYMWGNISTLLTQGARSPEEALDAWLEKPVNCQSLLNPEFQDVGIGYAPEQKYWTVILSSRPESGEGIYIYKE